MQRPDILSAAARVLGAVTLLAALPVFAHHSYAMFDMSKEVTLEGTVKEFQWTNPHIWIDLVVIDKDSGQPVKWSIEGSATTVLRGYGWRQDSMKAGDQVSLVIHPLKGGNGNSGSGNGGSLAKIAVNGKNLPTK